MSYSSIKRKKCKCGCDKFPTLGYGGYFSLHAPQELQDKVGSKRKVAMKNRAARVKIRSLLPSKEQSNLQELWFSMVSNEIKKNPYCWETGDFIPKEYKLFGTNKVKDNYRNCSCHILPKSIFPSVSTHPLNFLILSASNGSHDKTHRLDTFSKMKVWPIAVERFKQMEPYIKERHKLLNQFKDLVYGILE
jgi:hypothetical protein